MDGRDDYGRRTWDETEFEARFQARLKSEQQGREKSDSTANMPTSGDLKPLTARASFVELTNGINRRKVIGENIPLSHIGHYSCPVCQLYFKDSSVYLRHLNSPEHNAKMGMSLKVAEVTDDEVLARVEQWEDFYTMNIPVPPLYTEGV
jgi:hypothetical protein